MKDALEAFVQSRHPLPGLAAWGARLSDHRLVTQCYSEWFSDLQVERVLGRLIMAIEALGSHRIEPVRLCWTFEHARIHIGLRQDGLCLALFAENRPGGSTAEFDGALNDFVSATTFE